MTKQEFHRLRLFDLAKQRQPWTSVTTRRHNKNIAVGRGQIVRKSTITHDVWIEKVFTARP